MLIAARYYLNERRHIKFLKLTLQILQVFAHLLLECCNLLNHFFSFFFAFSLGKPAYKQFCIVIENLTGKCHYRLAVSTRAIRIIGVFAQCIHICMYPEVHTSEHLDINKIFSGHLHHRAQCIRPRLHNIQGSIKNHDIIAIVSYKQRVTFAYKKRLLFSILALACHERDTEYILRLLIIILFKYAIDKVVTDIVFRHC